MKVKICGITDIGTARHAKEIGADAIGFVFAESRRKVTVEQAAAISAMVNEDPVKVGVFVNESYENIMRTAEQASLDMIQLHGEEPPELARKIKLPVIKAFSFQKGMSVNGMLAYPADYLLLDSPAGAHRGGNGTAFDWHLLQDENFDRSRLILAGGLHHGNVKAAVTIVRPFMVDVSSGVESDGVKDQQKMNEFISAAKGAIKL
ncbi:phosphoribosylanthranilate isomerase [Mesobacillus zeae]|uniref:N-(5'-phosphoribosyl)anthranilate isomerase n=1 Tax=Mesobacillus zeae TaxID=1917180 RepID=A0A398B9K1_9BACI|nr:phosphoribosylanthranilate isomerase [Mesobacillus zeae]RID86799.1 phosphoribosylanthranilate isomerase [Mesobacillus zeae]